MLDSSSTGQSVDGWCGGYTRWALCVIVDAGQSLHITIVLHTAVPPLTSRHHRLNFTLPRTGNRLCVCVYVLFLPFLVFFFLFKLVHSIAQSSRRRILIRLHRYRYCARLRRYRRARP